MLLNSVKYYLSESVKSMFHNKIMFIVSVSTVAVCLSLLGMAMLLGYNLNYICDQLQAQFELQAFIDANLSIDQAKQLQSQIKGIDGVKDAVFESKDEALQRLKQMYSDDAGIFSGLENDNPLRHSYKIVLSDLSKADNVTQSLGKVNGVAKVINRKDVLNAIISTTATLERISFGATLLFALVAVFIISNTIRLSVHARRREIGIMKLVGATDWFIRWPFIIEGVIVGALGALLAFGPVIFGYKEFVHWWTGMLGIFSLKGLKDVAFSLFYTFILSGAIIGSFGSGLSLRKHLKI